MKDILSLTRLDLKTVRPYLTAKNMVLLLGVMLIFFLSTGESPAAVGMIMAYGTIFASYPFAVGEQNGIDALYGILGIQRRIVVAGRFCFGLLFQFFVTSFAFVMAAGRDLLVEGTLDLKTLGPVFALLFFLFTFIQLIQFPIFFKLGYAKAKIYAYLPYICLSLGILVLARLADKIPFSPATALDRLEEEPLAAIAAALGLWLAAVAASYFASVKAYDRRDF